MARMMQQEIGVHHAADVAAPVAVPGRVPQICTDLRIGIDKENGRPARFVAEDSTGWERARTLQSTVWHLARRRDLHR